MFLNTQAGRDDLPAHRVVKDSRKSLSLSVSPSLPPVVPFLSSRSFFFSRKILFYELL